MLIRALIALLTFIIGVAAVGVSRRARTTTPRPVASSTVPTQQITSPENTNIRYFAGTVAGPLESTATLDSWHITLNGKEILSRASLDQGSIEAVQPIYNVGGYDQVILLQAFSPLTYYYTPASSTWFLGLNADGTYYLSEEIEHSEFRPKELIAKDGILKLVFVQGRTRSRTTGPYDIWILKNRKLSHLRSD
jgi:hypothetical protein